MDEYSGTKKTKKMPWLIGALILIGIGAGFGILTIKGAPDLVSPLPESTSGDVRVIFVSPEPTATDSGELVTPSPTSEATPKASAKASPKASPKVSASPSSSPSVSPSSD